MADGFEQDAVVQAVRRVREAHRRFRRTDALLRQPRTVEVYRLADMISRDAEDIKNQRDALLRNIYEQVRRLNWLQELQWRCVHGPLNEASSSDPPEPPATTTPPPVMEADGREAPLDMAPTDPTEPPAPGDPAQE